MIPNRNCNNYKPILGTNVRVLKTAVRMKYPDGVLVMECNNFKKFVGECGTNCQMCVNNQVDENISILSSDQRS